MGYMSMFKLRIFEYRRKALYNANSVYKDIQNLEKIWIANRLADGSAPIYYLSFY